MRLAGTALVALLWPATGWAQASPCDKGLEALAHGPHGYALRGDRCEGIYAQQVSGSTVWIASLTQSFEDYDLTSAEDLVIEWTAPGDASVHLRAQGIKPDLFYRMDAVGAAASRAYRWPTDLLTARRIPRDDIGLLGWIRYPVGGADREVLLPLRVRQRAQAPDGGGYDLVLFPTVELEEVYVSLAAVAADGRPTKAILEGKPLRYGYYPAENPVHISLPSLPEPGLHVVEIGAELATGGSAALKSWFFHAR